MAFSLPTSSLTDIALSRAGSLLQVLRFLPGDLGDQATTASAGETIFVFIPRDRPELRYAAIDSCVTSPRNTRSASITGNHARLNSYMRDSRMRKCSSYAAVALKSRWYCAQVPV